MDWIQLTLIGTALVVDVLAPWAIGGRIFEFGFSPNRVAALGENIVLLVNLGGSAVIHAEFIRGRVACSRLCDWQKFSPYVLAAWAAVVALIFPVVFGSTRRVMTRTGVPAWQGAGRRGWTPLAAVAPDERGRARRPAAFMSPRRLLEDAPATSGRAC